MRKVPIIPLANLQLLAHTPAKQVNFFAGMSLATLQLFPCPLLGISKTAVVVSVAMAMARSLQ